MNVSTFRTKLRKFTQLSLENSFLKKSIRKIQSIFICIESLPFDQRTPFGYWGMIFFCANMGNSYLSLNASILLLYISISWHHRAFYERFRDSVVKLDERHDKQKTTFILCEMIRFHIRVKRFAHRN